MYFYMIENFAYGEINERSFSNPHPWTKCPPFYRRLFKFIASNLNRCIFIQISLKLVPNDPIYNKSASVQIMAWCR